MAQKIPRPRTKPPISPPANQSRHASTARLAKFVLTILEDGERGTLPYNPKWRTLEEQSYLVLANLHVLRRLMEARYQKGLDHDAVGDCLELLATAIDFLEAVDLTSLCMEKERAEPRERGRGKAA